MDWLIFISAIIALWLWSRFSAHRQRKRRKQRQEKRQRYIEENHIDENPPLYLDYQGYLKSDVWKAKREAVLERANNQCEIEGCENRAVEVHHIKYPNRWGREPLAWLIAVCPKCHDELHPEKESRHMTAEEAIEHLENLFR